jgi:hypothetical protein
MQPRSREPRARSPSSSYRRRSDPAYRIRRCTTGTPRRFDRSLGERESCARSNNAQGRKTVLTASDVQGGSARGLNSRFSYVCSAKKNPRDVSAYGGVTASIRRRRPAGSRLLLEREPREGAGYWIYYSNSAAPPKWAAGLFHPVSGPRESIDASTVSGDEQRAVLEPSARGSCAGSLRGPFGFGAVRDPSWLGRLPADLANCEACDKKDDLGEGLCKLSVEPEQQREVPDFRGRWNMRKLAVVCAGLALALLPSGAMAAPAGDSQDACAAGLVCEETARCPYGYSGVVVKHYDYFTGWTEVWGCVRNPWV